MLRLLVVTNLNGTLEPCGCFLRSAGGLDRLASALEVARAGSMPTLFLTAGPTFFDPRKTEDPLPLQERWEAAAMADALRDLRVDAALLDSRDVARAGTELRELARRAKFPLLSARAVETLELASSDGRMFERGQKIFVLAAPAPAAEGFSSSALNEISARIAEARSKGADLVLGMVSAQREQIALLAEQTRADVWVAATSERAAGASSVRGSIILEAGLDGEQLLVVEVGLGARSEPLHLVSSGAAKQGRWIAWKSVRLDSAVQPEPAFAERLRKLARKINEYNAGQAETDLPPSAGPQGAFAGSSPCGACHTAAYLWWRSSAHGRAYRTLQRVDKEFNLDCVGCHVTGYRKPGGATLASLEDRIHVGCESCHGPSAAHVDNPRDKRRPSAEVPVATCRECHDLQHSPDFEEARYRAQLRARGHGLPLGR